MTKYLKVCPRGFANEITYYAVPDNMPDADKEFDYLYDQGGYAEWSRDIEARQPGVAINWTDRQL